MPCVSGASTRNSAVPRREFIVTPIAAIAVVTFAILCPITSNVVSAGPLQDAAKEGDLNKIEQLLAQGADVNEKGLATALHYAIREGHGDRTANFRKKLSAAILLTVRWER